MKTYHQPRWIQQDDNCRSCRWPITKGKTYCPTCQEWHDKMVAIQMAHVESDPEKPYQKSYAEMEDYEFSAHKRKYGSCIDEDRKYFEGVLDHVL